MADDTTLATVDVESGCGGGSKKLRHAQSRSRFCIREATWLMEDTGGKLEGFFFNGYLSIPPPSRSVLGLV